MERLLVGYSLHAPLLSELKKKEREINDVSRAKSDHWLDHSDTNGSQLISETSGRCYKTMNLNL